MAVHRKKKSRKPAGILEGVVAGGVLGTSGMAIGRMLQAATNQASQSKKRKALHKKTLQNIQKRRASDIKRLEAKGDTKSKQRASRIRKNKKRTAKNEEFHVKYGGKNRQVKTYFNP